MKIEGKKASGDTAKTLVGNKRRSRLVLADTCIDALKGFLMENRRMKPAVALRLLKEKFTLENGKHPEDFPDDDRIKTNFSSITNAIS